MSLSIFSDPTRNPILDRALNSYGQAVGFLDSDRAVTLLNIAVNKLEIQLRNDYLKRTRGKALKESLYSTLKVSSIKLAMIIALSLKIFSNLTGPPIDCLISYFSSSEFPGVFPCLYDEYKDKLLTPVRHIINFMFFIYDSMFCLLGISLLHYFSKGENSLAVTIQKIKRVAADLSITTSPFDPVEMKVLTEAISRSQFPRSPLQSIIREMNMGQLLECRKLIESGEFESFKKFLRRDTYSFLSLFEQLFKCGSIEGAMNQLKISEKHFFSYIEKDPTVWEELVKYIITAQENKSEESKDSLEDATETTCKKNASIVVKLGQKLFQSKDRPGLFISEMQCMSGIKIPEAPIRRSMFF